MQTQSECRSLWLFPSLLVLLLAISESAGQTSCPDPATFRMADGFVAEKVLEVPPEMGSWVSLATTPDGIIASDQYGKLHRIRPGVDRQPATIETVPIELGHAHGLTWAFDALYVVAHRMNDQTPSGLYRVTDSDGDSALDKVELLRKIEGDGEHGPHAVIPGPDGESLYVCSGNHTQLVDIDASRVPRNWQEDHLLPRMNDPGGHAVGVLAPGGWICRTDRDGKSFELVSSGYRNQYDIAFDQNGELFTWDADMEWDIGTPWYRPTRVCHATSGSEFGWRNGDAKWPVYFPDSLPPAIDIGPGSPTGVTFGTGSAFPERFQKALFIADWSFGFIYAIHLIPDGATFRAEKEVFCSAAALQVTDMVIHSDGQMYFAIGGRRTPSALYRIRTKEPVEPGYTLGLPTAEAKLRHRLESFHLSGCSAESIDEAWDSLDHPDRFVRYAARVALEQTPLELWRDRAVNEANPNKSLELGLALARCLTAQAGSLDLMTGFIEQHFQWDKLDEAGRIGVLRIASLVVSRHGPIPDATRERINARFAEHFPCESANVNRELCRLLSVTGDAEVVAKTIPLMESASTQEDQIQFARCLRLVRNGWTDEWRRRYLKWFDKAAAMQGGSSFKGYLRNIREDFIAGLTAADRAALGELIAIETPEVDPYAELKARPIVKAWKMSDLAPALAKADWNNRNLDNGRNVFVQAQCFKCHQFQGEGGSVGPDLTGLHRRYTIEYLTETLVDPDKSISDQYQATVFEMSDGKLVVGRVANLVNDELMVQTDMIAPGKLTRLKRSEIEAMRASTTSPMPAGLLDSYTESDILDLLAWLRSAGPEETSEGK